MRIVLTVDRSKVVRAVVERHLERYGCVAVEATNADEAIAVARECTVSLILAESAAHAAAVRRRDARYDAVPIILLTTDDLGEPSHDGDPHVVATLRKPFDRPRFDAAVGGVLRMPERIDAQRADAGAAR